MTLLKTRHVKDVTVVQIRGRMTLGESNRRLRHSVAKARALGSKKILLDLKDVDCMDCSGLGELVCAYHSARQQGAELKLLTITNRVRELLRITRLINVFDVLEASD